MWFPTLSDSSISDLELEFDHNAEFIDNSIDSDSDGCTIQPYMYEPEREAPTESVCTPDSNLMTSRTSTSATTTTTGTRTSDTDTRWLLFFSVTYCFIIEIYL